MYFLVTAKAMLYSVMQFTTLIIQFDMFYDPPSPILYNILKCFTLNIFFLLV